MNADTTPPVLGLTNQPSLSSNVWDEVDFQIFKLRIDLFKHYASGA